MENAPLAIPERKYFYSRASEDAKGYTDYPFWEPVPSKQVPTM